eukprot:1369685-Amorphochlora_amoeboformis.AAC.1
MGADSSKPEIRYKKELLKLSWRCAILRVVLTVQNQANKDSKDPKRAIRAVGLANHVDGPIAPSAVGCSGYWYLFLSPGI